MSQFNIGDRVKNKRTGYIYSIRSLDHNGIGPYARVDRLDGHEAFCHSSYCLKDLKLVYPVIEYDPNQNGDMDDDI